MIDSEDEARLRQLQESVDSDPNSPSHHFNLGLFLWEKVDESKEFKEKAVEHFVISAKLNPNNGAAFRFLGHHYSRVSVDTQRASKCYQRAVTLNPDDFEAGEALCDLLDDGGKESLEIVVCREACEKSPRAFWAFRRLGYLQVHQKKWSEAVQSLQHAIRGYPTCADLWEALGLAYQRLGMFTAAIKGVLSSADLDIELRDRKIFQRTKVLWFNYRNLINLMQNPKIIVEDLQFFWELFSLEQSYGRAIELEDSRLFALVESGNILLMLGSFRKGIEQFRQALEMSPHNVAALYGLASGLLGLSKECAHSGAFGWGASLLEEASEVVKTSTSLAGNNACSWKLHGDIQLTYAKCFPWMEEGLSLETDGEAFRNSILSWKRKCLSAAIAANHSYQRSLHLAPWQANIYTDIAISLNLICSLEERSKPEPDAWQLPEKMSLGGLLLEGDNNDFWVALGCLSDNNALKQHALVRGLQLDVSLAVAWAYLGKLYRKVGEKQMARQAFDRARSIDPSLALPWAGMSVDIHAGGYTPDEAYESCLRAVQILPLAEFQTGLGKLAALSHHLSSPLVFGAIRQAVQRAPHCPEAHNLNGLVCEARSDFQSAVTAYRLARFTICTSTSMAPDSLFCDISINLARSLFMAGNALDAARECELLKKEGLLDSRGLQVYAISLWKLGENDQALSVARNLAASVSTMERTSSATSISLIFKLLYHISGIESAVTSILKMPRELLQSSKISFIISAIHALDHGSRLESVVAITRRFVTSYDEITGMHSLIALSKLVKHESKVNLEFQSRVNHLKKALHMFPNSCLIRNELGNILVSSKELKDTHTATRCVVIDPPGHSTVEVSKSAYKILGAAAIACYACGTTNQKFFPTCKDQCMHEGHATKQMQKWLHQEPWNHNARFLLILNILQKAREERFPLHLRNTLERLLSAALLDEVYSKKDVSYQYQKFQLLLCASEISFQGGNLYGCINHAKNASSLLLPDGLLFFAHLLLCRAYAVQEDFSGLQIEYLKCLQLKTDYPIGWLCLKFLVSCYKLQIDSNAIDLTFEECFKEQESTSNMWMAIFDVVRGQIFIRDQDFLSAQEAFARACSLAGADGCVLLCHGAICMELARQGYGSQFLSLAASSLRKAQGSSVIPLPIVSALLAQAEASLGSKAKWEKNLRLEWFSWPPEMRPAELYFQMHLLAKQLKVGSDSASNVESYQSPRKWVLQAIHLNPSCLRYWKVLPKVE